MTWDDITGGDRYHMLIASLPHMPRHFEVERVPINRIRLEERLRLLDTRDAAVARQVQDFLRWDRQPRGLRDADVVRHYQELMVGAKNPLVREMIAFRMDVRTVVSALRRRQRGMPPPLGVGQWASVIQRNWRQAQFDLGRHLPWIADVERLLAEGDALAVERRILEVTWSHWARLAERYVFSFETLLLYLARWEIVDRWVRLDLEKGRELFTGLVKEALHEHGQLFE
jgi:hypothetical protein